jgi:hypothetical protein
VLRGIDYQCRLNLIISHSTIPNSSTVFFMTAPGPLQQIHATVWKMMQVLSWKMLIQLRHLLWLGIQIFTSSHSVIPESTYIYHERMNRLHQLKNQYPIDLFNSFVARLRSANTHLFDERSSEGHD